MKSPVHTPHFVRASALGLTGGLLALSGLQFYWALGGEWGASAASGGESSDLSAGVRITSALIAVLLLGACLIVLGRVGYWRSPLPFGVFRWGTWAPTVALFLGALANFGAPTDSERYGNGPIALVLAVLALVVARSGPGRTRVRMHHRSVPSA